jgi:small multidrug resistance pump
MGYLYLLIAIVAEVIATSALKATEGFTRLLPSLVVVAGYAVSFYFFSQVLKTVAVGVAYAIWSGLGIVLITLAAILFYGQVPDRPAIIGIALIILGVVVINLFSRTVVR